jgi:hypothetical protein
VYVRGRNTRFAGEHSSLDREKGLVCVVGVFLEEAGEEFEIRRAKVVGVELA